MPKYILAHDFYVPNVGHFKRSSGGADFREIPAHITPPKSAVLYGGEAAAPVAVAPSLPYGANRPQTLEDVIATRTAEPVVDPRDELIKQLTARLEKLENQSGKPAPEVDAKDDPESGIEPAVDPELAKALAASRDTKPSKAGKETK